VEIFSPSVNLTIFFLIFGKYLNIKKINFFFSNFTYYKIEGGKKKKKKTLAQISFRVEIRGSKGSNL
jgi:hypothetical protein